MPKFQINAESVGDGMACVSVEGFLDAHTFEQMESAINALFADGTYKVMVELSKVWTNTRASGSDSTPGVLTTAACITLSARSRWVS